MNCLNCGNELKGKQKKYCKDACRKAHFRAYEPQRPLGVSGNVDQRPLGASANKGVLPSPDDFPHIYSGMVVWYVPSFDWKQGLPRHEWRLGVVNRFCANSKGDKAWVEIVAGINTGKCMAMGESDYVVSPNDVRPFDGLDWHKDYPDMYPSGKLADW
jgi:hypothetical protein